MSMEEKHQAEEGKQHIHHEESCCGHDHHHEHDRHHHPHKRCGDFQQDEKLTVTTHLQDPAIVVSAHYRTFADPQELSALLTVNMESAAARIEVMGGFIGHLKAAMDVHNVEFFSLTDREVYRQKGNESEILVTVTAILFAVQEADGEHLIRNMLKDIDKKVRK